MTPPRHLSLFITLGLFWGVSPSLYRYWGVLGMPVSHVIVLTGIGVAAALALICQLRGIDWIGGKKLHIFGLGCAVLMNVPFAMGLFFARHVPPTEMALIISTAPIVNYLVALATRRENAAPRRLAAILLGFVSTAILVITRQGMLSGDFSWWLIATFSLPILYSAYNFFAAAWWPHGCHPMAAGVAESTWSGLLAIPFRCSSPRPGHPTSCRSAPTGRCCWPAECGRWSASPSSPSSRKRVPSSPCRRSISPPPPQWSLRWPSMAGPISGSSCRSPC